MGTVANHAWSKAQLVVGLLVEDISAAIERQSKAPLHELPLERLVATFPPFCEMHAARPPLARHTILEVAFAPDEAFTPYLELTLRFVGQLAASPEQEGRPPPPTCAPRWPLACASRAYIGVGILFLRAEGPDVEAGAAAISGSLEARVPILFEVR